MRVLVQTRCSQCLGTIIIQSKPIAAHLSPLLSHALRDSAGTFPLNQWPGTRTGQPTSPSLTLHITAHPFVKNWEDGDVGWVEYLLFDVTNKPISHPSLVSSFHGAINDYLSALRKLTVGLLEMMADGLGIEPRNVLSRLVSGEESDQLFRLNHYPTWPQPVMQKTGFGEHTEPQIISVLWSNQIAGLQIALKDGSWVSVPPDPSSLFVNVGDTLQVLTNLKKHWWQVKGSPR